MNITGTAELRMHRRDDDANRGGVGDVFKRDFEHCRRVGAPVG
jgi:hypothetical protein